MNMIVEFLIDEFQFSIDSYAVFFILGNLFFSHAQAPIPLVSIRGNASKGTQNASVIILSLYC